MAIKEKSLHHLGREVAETLGDGVSSHEMKQQEDLFADMATRGIAPKRNRQRLVLIAAAAAVLLCAPAVIYLLASSPSFVLTVGDQKEVAYEGMWLQTEHKERIPILSNDGSKVVLDGHSAVRIVTSTMKEAEFDLSRGRLSAEIVKGQKTRWVVRAGPYSVTVLGTIFNVDWDATRDTLLVEVKRGTVMVEGTGLARHGVQLTAGTSLRADASTSTITMNPHKEIGETAKAKPKTTMVEPDARDGSGMMSSPASKRGKSKPKRGAAPLSPWMKHYSDGKHQQAVATASRMGLDNIYKTASQEELWSLVDAARISGNALVATHGLTHYRSRFPNSKKAKMAAFLIGRIYLVQSRKPKSAVNWFNTYLRESPGGPLAEESLGRLIGAYKSAGMKAKAKETADEYLKKYPKGPFSDMALSVILSK